MTLRAFRQEKHPSIIEFKSGQCRNDPKATSHTYAETADGLFPMCGYGWNRSNGKAFSIFRDLPGTEGSCVICQRNLATGRAPVIKGFYHKTKWI